MSIVFLSDLNTKNKQQLKTSNRIFPRIYSKNLTGENGKDIAKELLIFFMERTNVLDFFSVIEILSSALSIFEKEKNVLEYKFNDHINVVGDLHGNLFDLQGIFREFKPPSETNPYIFLGDFVDRGDYSIEVVLIIYLYKILYPKDVLILRGNHETRIINKQYGLMEQIILRYGNRSKEVYENLNFVFKYTPIAAILNSTAFVVHGGIWKYLANIDKIEDLNKLKREDFLYKYPSDLDDNLINDILWSRYNIKSTGFDKKRRFGIKDVQKFLKEHKLNTLIKGHDAQERGYFFQDLGKGFQLYIVHSQAFYDMGLSQEYNGAAIVLNKYFRIIDKYVYTPELGKKIKFDNTTPVPGINNDITILRIEFAKDDIFKRTFSEFSHVASKFDLKYSNEELYTLLNYFIDTTATKKIKDYFIKVKDLEDKGYTAEEIEKKLGTLPKVFNLKLDIPWNDKDSLDKIIKNSKV